MALPITGSIVLYQTDCRQLQKVIESFNPSPCRFLYLVDNSPERVNIDILNENIHYIFTGRNKGYGAGHNIAIRLAVTSGTKYHVIMNPDIEFETEVIDKLLTFMENNDNVLDVMPKVVDCFGQTQYLCKLLPTPFNLVFRRFSPNIGFLSFLDSKYCLKQFAYNRVINPPSLSGCFMFLRVLPMIQNNILFDEDFFLYCEDFDLVRRLHRIGKTVFYPDVSIVHHHDRASYRSMKMLFTHLKSAIKYFNKWGWFFDKERRMMNKKILQEIKSLL
jgi:GT2 family glycosyltransferase